MPLTYWNPRLPDRRCLAVIALGILLLGQLLLALHQLEHLSQEPAEAACELCALGGGQGAPLPKPTLGIAPAGKQVLSSVASVDNPPLLRPYRPQTQRAPPLPFRSKTRF